MFFSKFNLSLMCVHFRYCLTGFIFSLSFSIPASAADKARELMQMDLSELMKVEVTTASLFPEPIETAPGSITVISAEQINQRGYRHLGELLVDLPGVDVNHYADGISLDVLSFRGISGNNKILLLQDGIRVNSPSGDPIPIANNYPLYHLKQVEVIFGPGSALYGADAFSGVINMITKDSEDGNSAEMLVEAGDFGQRFSYFNINENIVEKLRFNIGGHLQSSDNPDLSHYYSDDLPNNGRGKYEQPVDSHSFNFKLSWDENLKLGYIRNFIANPTSAGAHSNFVDYSSKPDYQSLIQTAYAKLNVNLNSNLNLEINLDHSDYEIDPDSEFVNAFTDFKHQGYKYSTGSRTQFEPRLLWEVGQQRVLAGMSYTDLKAEPKTANLPQPYRSHNTQYYLNTDDNLPIEIFDVHEHNIGGYFQLSSQWTSQWATTIGARYDDHSTYGSSFTPRASLTFAQNKKTTWEFSYAESFLAPSPFYRFENYGGFSGDSNNDGIYESYFMHVPNEELQPEELKNIEFSVNHNPSPWMSLGAVLYHQQVDGIITATNSDEPRSDFVPGGEIFYTTENKNIGKLKNTGLELSSTYTTNLFSAQAKIWANAAIIHGTLDEFGTTHDLPYTTNAKFKGGITFNWNDKYILTPKIQWLGPTNGGVDTAGVDAPSHVIVHLHGQVLNFITKGMDLQLTVNNLFDQRYYEAGDGSAGSGSGLDKVPQDPRWIKLALKYQF
ncbi:MAG: TonB-dependent receptor [Gammaproteobacteria bacterium]|nr:TonB-dependent receptor [Gammaproteobacteria bacterium]